LILKIFKMADPIWRTKNVKIKNPIYLKPSFFLVFRTGDKFEVQIEKLKRIQWQSQSIKN